MSGPAGGWSTRPRRLLLAPAITGIEALSPPVVTPTARRRASGTNRLGVLRAARRQWPRQTAAEPRHHPFALPKRHGGADIQGGPLLSSDFF